MAECCDTKEIKQLCYAMKVNAKELYMIKAIDCNMDSHVAVGVGSENIILS